MKIHETYKYVFTDLANNFKTYNIIRLYFHTILGTKKIYYLNQLKKNLLLEMLIKRAQTTNILIVTFHFVNFE